ncbi:MAG: hypothetical protein LBR32_09590 [Propionibacteriaceae bacterium]|jgi:hypothetical protein|nr:hypothetical protein [Propionibacteriaceae bacterium]
MVWALVFGGIAAAGLVLLVCYAIWLWHKASDLYSEIEMLGKRADELSQLLAQVSLPAQ